MTIVAASALILALNIVTANCDICKAYYSFSLEKFIPDNACPETSRYCCGKCDYKYCCSIELFQIDQSSCNEKCNEHVINDGTIISEQICYGGYCNGKCNNRYCSLSYINRLDQTACKQLNMAKTEINTTISTTKVTTAKSSGNKNSSSVILWIICVTVTPFILVCLAWFCCRPNNSRVHRQQPRFGTNNSVGVGYNPENDPTYNNRYHEEYVSYDRNRGVILINVIQKDDLPPSYEAVTANTNPNESNKF